MLKIARSITALTFFMALAMASIGAHAGGGHSGEGADDHSQAGAVEDLREMHKNHQHGHDFQAMDEMPPEQAARMVSLMRDIGIALPPMDATRGRELFVDKGCVICHSVNGVGAEVGPSLNAADMPSPMNAFEFAARMWRGAAAMSAMQEEELGGIINLTGQELADLVAFAHDDEEQKKLTMGQVPEKFHDKLEQ